MFENSIVNFIETLRICSNKDIKSGEDLYRAIEDNGDLILNLCEAAMQTCDNIDKVKKWLVQIQRLLG